MFFFLQYLLVNLECQKSSIQFGFLLKILQWTDNDASETIYFYSRLALLVWIWNLDVKTFLKTAKFFFTPGLIEHLNLKNLIYVVETQ